MKPIIKKILKYFPLTHDFVVFNESRPMRIKLEAAMNVFHWQSDRYLQKLDAYMDAFNESNRHFYDDHIQQLHANAEEQQHKSNYAYDRLMRLIAEYKEFQRNNYWFYLA